MRLLAPRVVLLSLLALPISLPGCADAAESPSLPREATIEVAPIGGPHAAELSPRDETEAPDEREPTADPAEAPPPFDDDGDVALRVEHLGTGSVAHIFSVERTCPLGRVELDVELDSMPDGTVTLRAPWGAEARLPLHVLTTTHFVRTWDWAMLDAFHSQRGHDIAGEWELETRLPGATYGGGTQPAAPMPTPAIVSADLRVWCEPTAASHEGAPDPIAVERDAPPAARRPGASVRALIAVNESCNIDALAVHVRERRLLDGLGVRFQLVTPAGDVLRVPLPQFGPEGIEREHSVDIGRAAGLSSEGIWELRAPRAAGSVELARVGLTIRCR